MLYISIELEVLLSILGGFMLIEYFAIEQLFGYQNFAIRFRKKDTIFVGENGMGKTTILSVLYHTLSLNFKELETYDFSLIKIKYKGQPEFILKRKDIELFNRRDNRNHWHGELPDEFIKRIEDVIDKLDVRVEEIDDNIRLIASELEKKGMELPYRMIKEAIDYTYQKNADGLKEFFMATKSILKDFKILYFPTYRRIEEDIYSVNSEDRAMYDNNETYYYSSSNKRRRKSNNIGELIQFGMKDVQTTLDDLLDTIKKTSIESFNKMTGELLYQYVNNDIETHEKALNLTEEEILISLSRVGTEIKSDLQNKIIEMYKNKTLENNKYLMNFIINLVDKNHNLEHIDNKIQTFVNICNTYLYGKHFVYDPSAVTLEIQSLNHTGVIPLSKLSSGEKQIISTFSKIYLKNDEHLIILFDEPELSLSIDWQKRFIYDVTKSENCEFSISVTHSGYIFTNLMENATELKKYLEVVD